MEVLVSEEKTQEDSQILITFANRDSVNVEIAIKNISAAQLILAAIWLDRKGRQVMDLAEVQQQEQMRSQILLPKIKRVD